MARIQISHEKWRYWRVGPHEDVTYRFCYSLEADHGNYHAWTQEVRRTGGGWIKSDLQIREHTDDEWGGGHEHARDDARQRKDQKLEEMRKSGTHYEILVKRLEETSRLPENLPSVVRHVRARVAQRDFIVKPKNGYGYRLYLRHKHDAETLAFEFKVFGCGDTFRDTRQTKDVWLVEHRFGLEHRSGWKNVD